MSKKSYRQAINEALAQEMRRDPTVIVMGEDNAGGMGAPGEDDAWGGVLGVTKGLMPEFGRDRVLDTPITESAFIGAAVGAAATGLRPVAELMFVDFLGVCFDQIFNQAAKFRYMFGGKAVTPVVIRTMYGAGFRAASQHSQCLYPIFTHIPGLKVVVPSSAYEAKGLLIQSIRDNDPVIFLEHKVLYDEIEEVPDEPYTIPFGEANLTREGDDVTIVALGRMVGFRQQGRRHAAKGRHHLHRRRSAHDLSPGRGHDHRSGRGHRQAGGGGRGQPALRHGGRHLGPGGAERLQGAEGPHPHGDPAAHAGALRAAVGRRLHPDAGQDRRRGPSGHGLKAAGCSSEDL